jgi:hypothetical protein
MNLLHTVQIPTIKLGQFGGIYDIAANVFENNNTELKEFIKNYQLPETELNNIYYNGYVYTILEHLDNGEMLCVGTKNDYILIASKYEKIARHDYFIHKLNKVFDVCGEAHKQFGALLMPIDDFVVIGDARTVIITNDYSYNMKTVILYDTLYTFLGLVRYRHIFNFDLDGNFITTYNDLYSVGDIEKYFDNILQEECLSYDKRFQYLLKIFKTTRFTNSTELTDYKLQIQIR